MVARFVGDFRSVDREWVQELDLGDRLELLDYLPHRRALELQRDSEANLLLLPEAAGRGKVVPSGKIFEYLAAERPILAAVPTDGAAAQLVRETGAGVVVAPDDEDGLREALRRPARALAGRAAGERLPERGAAAPALAHDPRRGAGRAALEPRVTRESRLVPFFFLAAVFTCTFAKVQWSAGGNLFLADLTAGGFLLFYGLDRLGRGGRPAPRTAAVLLVFLAAFLLVYLIGFFNLETGQALDQFVKGLTKWLLHFGFLIVGVVYLARKSLAFYWRTLAWFLGGIAVNGAYGILQLLAAQAGHNLDSVVLEPLTHGASQINIYGAVNGSSVYRPNALTGDPNHLAIELLLPILILSPIYLRLERGHRLRTPLAVLIAFLLLVELATLSRSGLLGLVRRGDRAADPVPAPALLAARAAAARPGRAAGRVRALPAAALLQRRDPLADPDRRQLDERAPRRLRLHPAGAAPASALRARLQQLLGLLRVRHRQDELGAALVLRDADRRGRARRDGAVRGLPLVAVRAASAWPGGSAQALAAAGDPLAARLRPLAWGMTAALVGTLASNAFYLTIPFLYFYVFVMLVLATPAVFSRAMKVVVLTTSYPRYEGDPAGNFVADAVEQLRERGRRGRGRLAGVVPPLRDRVRLGRDGEPASARRGSWRSCRR